MFRAWQIYGPNLSEFKTSWEQHHKGRRPIGHLLALDGAKNRLCFGALPEPKRYADTPQRRELLLAWQNLLAAATLGETACWLVQCQRVSSDGFADIAGAADPIRATRQYGLFFGFEFLVEEQGGGASRWRAFARQTIWAVGEYDSLLLDIAEGQAAPTLWMSSGSGAIFAPSERGVDLCLPSKSDVSSLTGALVGWRPLEQSGDVLPRDERQSALLFRQSGAARMAAINVDDMTS